MAMRSGTGVPGVITAGVAAALATVAITLVLLRRRVRAKPRTSRNAASVGALYGAGGSVFLCALPSLAIGAVITVTDGTQVWYTLTLALAFGAAVLPIALPVCMILGALAALAVRAR